MKKIKIVFITSLIFSLLFNCFALADFSLVQTNLLDAAKSYAMNNVEEFIASGDAGILWNESTTISSHIELYAPDNTVNGYIFHFKTEDVPSGFMQIGVLDTEFYVVNLGFEGEDLLTKMISHYNFTQAANANSTALAASTVSTSSKVYYIGGFDYCVYDSKHELLNLSSGAVIPDRLNELNEKYEIYQNAINTSLADVSDVMAASTSTTYTVDGYYDAETYMKTMNNYSGYDNHCSPTAATNMVMYYKYGRDYFPSNSSDASTVFDWFYENMDTNVSKIGTSRDDIWPAYADYFIDYSGMETAITDRITSVTYNKIKAKINADIPLHLSINDYEGEGNHSVNLWGYTSISSGDFLRITDNWGSSVSNMLINYDNYDYAQYVFYGPN